HCACAVYLLFSCRLHRQPPCSTLFPYTTLFRSKALEKLGFGDEQKVLTRFPRNESTRKGNLAEVVLAEYIVARFPFRVDSFRGKDRKSTRLNSSHVKISYAVFCLKKKKKRKNHR